MEENKTTHRRHSRLSIMTIVAALLLGVHTVFSAVTCCIDAKQVLEVFSTSEGGATSLLMVALFVLCYLIPAFLSGFLVYKLVRSLLPERQTSSPKATLDTGRIMALALLLLAVEIALIVIWCHPFSFPLRNIRWCAALAYFLGIFAIEMVLVSAIAALLLVIVHVKSKKPSNETAK